MDPNLPITRLQRMKEQVAGNFGQQRVMARLTSLFGVLAMVLASIGLYGVTAYNESCQADQLTQPSPSTMGAKRFQTRSDVSAR